MRHAILDSGVKIITNGLRLWVDAAQLRSYPGSGSTWTDVSATGNNFALTGTTFNSGNGGALSFTSLSDYGTISSPTASMITTNVTVEVWQKCNNPTSNTNLWHYISFSNLSAGNVFLYKNPANTWVSGVRNTSGTYYQASYAGAANTNWIHLAFTYDGTTLRNYYNGGVDNTAAGSGSIQTSGTATVYVGRHSGNAIPFDGLIAIVRSYDRALSSTEVLQNYNAEKSRFGL